MSALAERMAPGATTVARAWVLRRGDGLVLGFTDHDRDLEVDGVACRASAGLSARALETGTGLAVDNSEAAGVLSDDAISEADIRAGRWDGAAVVIYLVDWTAPEAFEVLFRGTLGEIAHGGGAFTAELRGQTDALGAPRGRVFHARCDAVLGDARCGVDMDGPGMAEDVVVAAVAADGAIEVSGAERYAAGWFGRGRMVVLDGEAAGPAERIRLDRPTASGRSLSLWGPLGAAPSAGDRLRIEAGGDKALGTCRTKFANVPNFRGFPHIPGDDWLIAHPARASA